MENEKSKGLKIDKKTVIGFTVILLVVWLAAAAMTRIIPRGQYLSDDPAAQSSSSEIAEGAEYTPNDGYTMPVWKIIAAPVMVFAEADTRETAMTGLLIIAFIVLMGGTFLLLDSAGVLGGIVALLVKRFGRHKYLLMAVLVFFFMALSSTAGVLEESVTIVPIAVALSLALGWDSLVGLGMSLVAVAFGFTAATFNPFNVMTVQKVGGVEIFSGLWLRLIVFVLVYAVLYGFLAVYARRIEKDPKKSLCYESDVETRKKYRLDDSEKLINDRKTVRASRAFGLFVALTFVCIVLDFALSMGGTLSMGGLAVCFVSGGIVAAKITGFSFKKILKGFGEGIKTVAPIVPVVFMIISIAYILNKGMIMHTIIHFLEGAMKSVSPYAAILIFFVFIALLEFFIGSGTAKAFLVMPVILPLAHFCGISVNTVAVAFSLADGFTNLLYPTSGIMLIAIGLVGVSYPKWLKWTAPLFIMEAAVSVAVMLFAVKIGYC